MRHYAKKRGAKIFYVPDCNSMFVFLCCVFQISCENKFMGFIDSGMVVVLIITVVLLIVTALLLFYNFEVGIL